MQGEGDIVWKSLSRDWFISTPRFQSAVPTWDSYTLEMFYTAMGWFRCKMMTETDRFFLTEVFIAELIKQALEAPFLLMLECGNGRGTIKTYQSETTQ